MRSVEAEPLTYTIREAAVILKIHRATAYRLVQRGELPVVRIGSVLRVPARELQRLLERGAVEPGADR